MNFTPLTAYLDSLCEAKNMPMVACAVYYRHQPVYQHCHGWANVEERRPMAPDTLFHLFSASKAATVTAGLQLMDAGKFSLDDPLSEYLPEFAHPTVRVTNPDGTEEIVLAKNPILVRHLFSMQAGLSYNNNTPEVAAVKEATGGRCPTREVVRAIAKTPLLFEPGTHFKYSMCHDVLGGLIEEVSGQKFGEYLQEHIFAPLGMTDTYFYLPEEKMSRLAPEYHDYDFATGKARAVVLHNGMNMGMGPEYESGGGGLTTSLQDYILLVETLANRGLSPNGVRILRPETVELLRQDQTDDISRRDFEEMGGWSKMGYGYGLGVRTLINRERNNSLSRNGEFGWDGALGCYWVADPDSEVAIFYVQQAGGNAWWEWHGTVRNTVYACLGD